MEKIIKWAARINNSKIAGPFGRVVRDAMLPPIMKMTADSKALRQTFDYHLEWDAPARATPRARPPERDPQSATA